MHFRSPSCRKAPPMTGYVFVTLRYRTLLTKGLIRFGKNYLIGLHCKKTFLVLGDCSICKIVHLQYIHETHRELSTVSAQGTMEANRTSDSSAFKSCWQLLFSRLQTSTARQLHLICLIFVTEFEWQ